MTLAPSVTAAVDRLLNGEVVAAAVGVTDLVRRNRARWAPRRPRLPRLGGIAGEVVHRGGMVPATCVPWP